MVQQQNKVPSISTDSSIQELRHCGSFRTKVLEGNSLGSLCHDRQEGDEPVGAQRTILISAVHALGIFAVKFCTGASKPTRGVADDTWRVFMLGACAI